MQQPDLSGKTALITGGGRGIGRATALAIARCGARIVLTARTAAEIEAVAREIEAEGGEAHAIQADLSNAGQITALMERSGDIDILVNNAGVIWPIAPVRSADPGTWADSITINLTSVFHTMHGVLPGMLDRGWGRIINVSSGAARGTTAGWSAYSAAKAGVEALTSVAAREVGAANVRINAMRPGIVDTEMQVEIRSSSEEDFTPENVRRFRGYKERGSLRPPEDPARLIVWLLSPDADEHNGEVFAIDDPEVAAKIGLEIRAR